MSDRLIVVMIVALLAALAAHLLVRRRQRRQRLERERRAQEAAHRHVHTIVTRPDFQFPSPQLAWLVTHLIQRQDYVAALKALEADARLRGIGYSTGEDP